MSSLEKPALSKQKILIVEDDESISSFLLKSIEFLGISASVAFTGAQAIERASRGGISLMTIDYSLPDMTGEHLISTLRAAGIDIPFIMITGMGDEDIAVSSMKLGARDYIVKTDDLFDRVPKVITEILEKIAAEERLQAAHSALQDYEERFRQVFYTSNDGIILLDEKLSVEDVNPRGLHFLEYDAPEELAAQGLSSIIPPEHLESLGAVLSQRDENPAYRFETTFRKKNGETFPADVVTSVFTAGGSRHVLLNFRDISDRIRHLETVSKAAEEWRTTFDSINDLVSVHDRDMRIIRANKAFVDFFGLPYTEIIGRKCYDVLHPGGITFDSCPHRKTIEKGIVITEEVFYPEIGIPLLVTTSPIFDAQGEIAGTVHIAKDISNLKRIHDELLEKEHFLSEILDSIQDGIVILDNEFRIVRTNRYIEEKYAGRMPLVGKKCYDIFQNRQEPCDVCPTRRTCETGQPSSEILSFKMPDQKICGWMEVFTYPLLDAKSGELKGVIEYMRDITLRQEMEKSLLESEEKYRRLFDDAIDAIVVAEIKTARIVDCNRAAEELFCKDKEDMTGANLRDLFSSDEHAEAFLKIAHDSPGDSSHDNVQSRIVQKDGTFREVSINVNTVSYHDEIFLNCAFRDITDKKKMRQRLKQAQKLESIGTLAGGIAHDFNNILTAILGYSDIVKTDLLSDKKPELDDVDGIIEAGHRAAELVKQVLTFSRQSEMERRCVSFTPIVKETIKFLRASLPSTIIIEQHIVNISRPVFADPVQLHQVIMNLCTNAHHAMRKKGGTLSITLEEISLTDEYIGSEKQLPTGQYVRLSVSDTGHGMDELTISRIFDPFFSTKSRDEGTGLGLSVVHGIIQSHGGKIHVYSQVNVGTTFRVYLPIAKETEDLTVKQEETAVPRGNERILLVDDEKSIAETGKRMLAGLGYEVTACTDSVHCLETFRSSPDQFDLVLTDLTMPNLTGLDLAREIKSLSPRTPVILMTGFANALDENNLAEHFLDYLVKKPVLKKDISRAIRSVLDSTTRNKEIIAE